MILSFMRIFTSLILFIFFNGCDSQVEFKGTGNIESQNNGEESNSSKSGSTYTSKIQTNKTDNSNEDDPQVIEVGQTIEPASVIPKLPQYIGPLDIVWVISNDVYNRNHGERVSLLLSSMDSELSNNPNVKVAIINPQGSVKNAQHYSTSVNDMQSPYGTGFEDSELLMGAASAMCPSGSTYSNQAPFTICNKKINDFNAPDNYFSQYRGKLTNFFRPNAKRSIIFVTSSDASHVKPNEFLDMIHSANNWKKEDTKIFSSSDLAYKKCEKGRIGQRYKDLASLSKGKTLGFCNAKKRDILNAVMNH